MKLFFFIIHHFGTHEEAFCLLYFCGSLKSFAFCLGIIKRQIDNQVINIFTIKRLDNRN